MFSKSLLFSSLVLAASMASASSPASWRSSSTHPDQNQKIATTSAAREKEIQSKQAWQISMIDGSMLGSSDTPPFYFIPSAKVQTLKRFDGNGDHGQYSEMTVSGLGSTGMLKGTLLLPVSGHAGFSSAKVWAKQDKYQVVLEYVSPQTHPQNYGNKTPTVLVKDGQSLDLVTKHEVTIPMKKGQSVLVLYWRNGSGGVGGYPEGRVLKINWDGK